MVADPSWTSLGGLWWDIHGGCCLTLAQNPCQRGGSQIRAGS